MDISPALARYAYALGRWQAGWRAAAPELRRAAGLAQISAAWDSFRRNAGPGDVGPAHEDPAGVAGVTRTDDPRRDGVLLWLADHGAPAIAEAAGTVVRMVGATRRFGAEDQALLAAARDALAAGAGRRGGIARAFPMADDEDDALLAPLQALAGAIDRLRGDAAFLEGAGGEVMHRLRGGTVGHYVPGAPGAAWALDLALLAAGSPFGAGMPVPGLASRALFRPDQEPEEIAAKLVEGVAFALDQGDRRLGQLAPEIARGRTALAALSRNARARDAWLLVAALRSVTRTQVGRALVLSRAGADIQARTLAKAGLVTLAAGGWIGWAPPQSAEAPPDRLEQGPLGDAMADLDASMAEIDRLLAQTAQGSDLSN